MTGRDTHMDNAKGVLITLVVMGHLVWPVPGPGRDATALYIFIYFFHMPMFALVSGYFSHARLDGSRLLTLLRRLLVPYALFVTIKLGLLTWLQQPTQPITEGHYGLWFLLSLLCWRLLLPGFLRLPRPLALAAFLALACGFAPFVDMTFSLSRTLVLFPFFLGGYLLRQRLRKPVSVMPRPMAVVFVIGAVALAFWLSNWPFEHLLHHNQPYPTAGAGTLMGVTTRAAVMTVAALLGLSVLALIPKGESFLTRIGEHSLSVYLLHALLLVAYRAWPEAYGAIGREPLLIVPMAPAIAWLLASAPVVRLTRRLVAPLG